MDVVDIFAHLTFKLRIACQKRIAYNNANIGTLGYQIYLKDSNGNLQSLGFTNNNSFTYKADSSLSNYTFVIKSAYSIFKSNMSNGLTINVSVKIDSNVEEIIKPEPEQNTNNNTQINNGTTNNTN